MVNDLRPPAPSIAVVKQLSVEDSLHWLYGLARGACAQEVPSEKTAVQFLFDFCKSLASTERQELANVLQGSDASTACQAALPGTPKVKKPRLKKKADQPTHEAEENQEQEEEGGVEQPTSKPNANKFEIGTKAAERAVALEDLSLTDLANSEPIESKPKAKKLKAKQREDANEDGDKMDRAQAKAEVTVKRRKAEKRKDDTGGEEGGGKVEAEQAKPKAKGKSAKRQKEGHATEGASQPPQHEDGALGLNEEGGRGGEQPGADGVHRREGAAGLDGATRVKRKAKASEEDLPGSTKRKDGAASGDARSPKKPKKDANGDWNTVLDMILKLAQNPCQSLTAHQRKAATSYLRYRHKVFADTADLPDPYVNLQAGSLGSERTEEPKGEKKPRAPKSQKGGPDSGSGLAQASIREGSSKGGSEPGDLTRKAAKEAKQASEPQPLLHEEASPGHVDGNTGPAPVKQRKGSKAEGPSSPRRRRKDSPDREARKPTGDTGKEKAGSKESTGRSPKAKGDGREAAKPLSRLKPNGKLVEKREASEAKPSRPSPSRNPAKAAASGTGKGSPAAVEALLPRPDARLPLPKLTNVIKDTVRMRFPVGYTLPSKTQVLHRVRQVVKRLDDTAITISPRNYTMFIHFANPQDAEQAFLHLDKKAAAFFSAPSGTIKVFLEPFRPPTPKSSLFPARPGEFGHSSSSVLQRMPGSSLGPKPAPVKSILKSSGAGASVPAPAPRVGAATKSGISAAADARTDSAPLPRQNAGSSYGQPPAAPLPAGARPAGPLPQMGQVAPSRVTQIGASQGLSSISIQRATAHQVPRDPRAAPRRSAPPSASAPAPAPGPPPPPPPAPASVQQPSWSAAPAPPMPAPSVLPEADLGTVDLLAILANAGISAPAPMVPGGGGPGQVFGPGAPALAGALATSGVPGGPPAGGPATADISNDFLQLLSKLQG